MKLVLSPEFNVCFYGTFSFAGGLRTPNTRAPSFSHVPILQPFRRALGVDRCIRDSSRGLTQVLPSFPVVPVRLFGSEKDKRKLKAWVREWSKEKEERKIAKKAEEKTADES